MLKVFCGLILWAACAAAQTVEGSVINSATGGGIANVKVELLKAASSLIEGLSGAVLYSATTDTHGHFRIEQVEDGVYTARYRSTEGPLIDESMTPGRAGEPRPAFHVTAGPNPVKLEARMTQLARITGRAIDDAGRAIPNAGVQLIESGRRLMLVPTDARGNFEVRAFPGVYTLGMIPPPNWKPPDPDPDGNRLRRWVPVYYPGVTSPEAASAIVLRPGADLSSIELKLLAVPAHSVRGVVLRPDGAPAPHVSISMEDDSTAIQVESKADGAFEFPAVVDGEIRFSATVESDGVALRAAQAMQMTGREVTGVKLRLNAPFTVAGRVVVETPQGVPAVQPPSVRLSPVSHGRGADPAAFASTDADGNFSLERVYPGAYHLGALEPPAGYYLDAMRLGEVDLATAEVELFSGAVPVALVYKTNGGTIRGKVEKCGSGGIVLVPQEPAMRWPELIRTARCDSSDRYEITTVRPGEYYAQAFPPDLSSPFWAPKFDEGFVNWASRITVRGGEDSSADLRVITAQQ